MSAALQITGLFASMGGLTYLLPKVVPLKLLRLIPVISSTISLQFAYDEYAFLSRWVQPAYRAQADALLPPWFTSWGPWGTKVVFGSFTISIASGLANFLAGREVGEAAAARYWYAAGLGFAAAHLLVWGPTALKLLAKIRKGEPEGRATESMSKWLSMHLTRSILVDLPAVVCFVAGLMSVVDVVM